jgi:hypothetical protein
VESIYFVLDVGRAQVGQLTGVLYINTIMAPAFQVSQDVTLVPSNDFLMRMQFYYFVLSWGLYQKECMCINW